MVASISFCPFIINFMCMYLVLLLVRQQRCLRRAETRTMKQQFVAVPSQKNRNVCRPFWNRHRHRHCHFHGHRHRNFPLPVHSRRHYINYKTFATPHLLEREIDREVRKRGGGENGASSCLTNGATTSKSHAKL